MLSVLARHTRPLVFSSATAPRFLFRRWASDVRVRFAPSPTGNLHLGGLRTALFNYLFAKKHKGSFIVRVEDTDQKRLVPGSADAMLNALEWAGIPPDESPRHGGPSGPYVQSERRPIYAEHAQALLEQGHAYPCFCTEEALKARRAQSPVSAPYDGHCRHLSQNQRDTLLAEGTPHVLRLAVPRQHNASDTTITLHDATRGSIPFAYSTIDDAVLVKSDGMPTYHLANVVDDHLMRISHVFRGEEWLSSAPKHLLLYRAFGWSPPTFAHLPLLHNAQGKKLSKRQGDLDVASYRSLGVQPEALLNFAALLGWNPGTTQEVFPLPALVDAFSLEGINLAPAMVRPDRLMWMNKEHILLSTPTSACASPTLIADLAREVRETLPSVATPPAEYLSRVLYACRERIRILRDIPKRFPFFFIPPTGESPEAVKYLLNTANLSVTQSILESTLRLMEASVKSTILDDVGAHGGWELNDVRRALRFALMDSRTGPGVVPVMDVLGATETKARVSDALRRLSASAAIPAREG